MRTSTAVTTVAVLLGMAACSEPAATGPDTGPSLDLIATPAGDEINTFASWNGTADAATLGGLSGMGQSFTAIGSGKLESFSFWLENQYMGGDLRFNVFVVQWDGAAAVGPVLFQAGPFQGVSTPNQVFTRFDFPTGGLALTPGTQYVALLLPDGSSGAGQNRLAFVGDTYTGGSGIGGIFYDYGVDQPSDVHTWFAYPGDMAFIAKFAPADPVTLDDCKSGGWEAYGFRNQGQCIRFVNTGKDSR